MAASAVCPSPLAPTRAQPGMSTPYAVVVLLDGLRDVHGLGHHGSLGLGLALDRIARGSAGPAQA
jgi:hypothetical protein